MIYSLATVAYADVFDYPLTIEEFRLWYVKRRNLPLRLPPGVVRQGAYIYLKGRWSIVSERKKRLLASKEKWRIARRVGRWLRFVPTIQLVGVTGGLAMDNVDYKDDIDLFIITKSNSLWTTRLLATIVVDLLRVRRKPGETDVENKICLNMFVSEDALSVPAKERDLFAAHEVLQMKSLWDRGGMYAKFLVKNKWVEKFLPNAWEEKCKM